jgi:uncharacterized membrane protein
MRESISGTGLAVIVGFLVLLAIAAVLSAVAFVTLPTAAV